MCSWGRSRGCDEIREDFGERASSVCSSSIGPSFDLFHHPHRSNELFAFLNDLHEDPVVGPNILDVRGRGLMVAVEFASPSGSSHDPMVKPTAPKTLANRVAKRCIEKGLLILTTSVYEVIRFIPPLNITQADLKTGCEIFKESVEEIVKEG
jgi:4-aminobutyrate aminotransferase